MNYLSNVLILFAALIPLLGTAQESDDEISYPIGPDRVVAILRGATSTVIRSFDGNGKRTGSFTRPNNKSTGYLPGRWNGTPSIAELKFLASKVSVKFREEGGRVFGTLQLQIPVARIKSVVVGDYDNSGLSDILLVDKNNVATLALNPGGGNPTLQSTTLPAGSSVAPLVTDLGTVGLAIFNDAADSIAMTTASGAPMGVITLQGQARGQLVPLSFGPQTPGFAIVSRNEFKLYDGTGQRLGTTSRSLDTQVVSGDFSGANSPNRDLAIVTNGGDLTILTNRLQEERFLSIDLTRSTNGGCNVARIKQLQDRIYRVSEQGNFTLVARLTEELMRLIGSPKCRSLLQNLGSNGSIKNRVQIAGFQLNINGGEGLHCDTFRDPKDGPGGFLAKVADKDGKLVVLFPGNETYVAAEILKPRSYSTRDTLYDAGLGNPDQFGFRNHFRSKKFTPRQLGNVILKAERSDGQRICFRLDFRRGLRID